MCPGQWGIPWREADVPGKGSAEGCHSLPPHPSPPTHLLQLMWPQVEPRGSMGTGAGAVDGADTCQVAGQWIGHKWETGAELAPGFPEHLWPLSPEWVPQLGSRPSGVSTGQPRPSHPAPPALAGP